MADGFHAPYLWEGPPTFKAMEPIPEPDDLSLAMLRTKHVYSHLHSSLPRNNYPDFDIYSRAKEFSAASFSSKESGRSRGLGIDAKEVSDVMCEIASRVSSNAILADKRRFASATSIPRETLI